VTIVSVLLCLGIPAAALAVVHVLIERAADRAMEQYRHECDPLLVAARAELDREFPT